MSRLRQIKVKPLNDERWSKVERSLFLRLEEEERAPARDASRRPAGFGARAWVGAAVVLVAAAAAFVLFMRPPAPAVIEQPSRITTGVSTSHLALAGLALDVEPESAVVVGAEMPQGLLIVVDRGGILCEVAPRPADAPLIVQAGATRVRVVGTRFSVHRVGESAVVKVQHGAVDVSSGGRSWRVAAGQEWPVPEARSSAAPGPVPPASAGSSAGAEAVAPGAPSVPQRASPVSRARNLQEVASPPADGRTAAVAAGAKSFEPSRQHIFKQAAALERRDLNRATELYAELEPAQDSWAQNALYARARLEDSRGNRGEAQRLLELYLERFPRGSNAEDARAVLQRLR